MRAKVYRGSSTPQVAETRTNREMSFTIFNADVVLSLIRDRIAAASGAPVTHFEIAKLLHYSPGEQFALHADFIEAKTPELARDLAARGQRAATFLIYLNDGYEGGATQFPRLDWQYRGGRGDALLFSNVDAAALPTTTPCTPACRRPPARNGCCRSGSARARSGPSLVPVSIPAFRRYACSGAICTA